MLQSFSLREAGGGSERNVWTSDSFSNLYDRVAHVPPLIPHPSVDSPFGVVLSESSLAGQHISVLEPPWGRWCGCGDVRTRNATSTKAKTLLDSNIQPYTWGWASVAECETRFCAKEP